MYKLQPYYDGNIRFEKEFLDVLYRTPKFNDRSELTYEMLQGIFLKNCLPASGNAGSRFETIQKRAQELDARIEKLGSNFGSVSISSSTGSGRLNEAELMIDCDMRNIPFSLLLLATMSKYRVNVHVHSSLIVGSRLTAAEQKTIESLKSWLNATGRNSRADQPAIRLVVRETPLSDVFLSWNGMPQVIGEVNLLRFLAAVGKDAAHSIDSTENRWLDAAEMKFALATSRDRATFLKALATYFESRTNNTGAKCSPLDAYLFTLLVRTGFDRASCPRRVASWFDDLASRNPECASMVTAFAASR